MRKSETTAFSFTFSNRKIYILLENIFGKTQFILLHLLYRFFTWQVIGNSVTPTSIQKSTGFVDAILRSKILHNRLGFLTQILITMDYSFYLHISDIYFQFSEKMYLNLGNQLHHKKYIRKRIEILAKRVFISQVFNMKFMVIFFIRKSICQGELFGSLHTSKWIYIPQNCFSNYVYLKDMCMNLKGIGKILFVSVLRILIICKTLNFTAVFTKKIPKVCIQFFV